MSVLGIQRNQDTRGGGRAHRTEGGLLNPLQVLRQSAILIHLVPDISPAPSQVTVTGDFAYQAPDNLEFAYRTLNSKQHIRSVLIIQRSIGNFEAFA